MKKYVWLVVLLLGLLAAAPVSADPEEENGGRIADIQERGVLLVGTTGDYRPMSFLDEENETYEGFDVELAQRLAEALGVDTVEFVPTTWPQLLQDTVDGKFDVAMCGITKTAVREEAADMSRGYLTFGKTILVRSADADKYRTLEDLNRPEVRVMVNPGGTNEKFAKEKLPKATLLIHPKNAEIPALVADGKADVMITETMEARRCVRDDSRLAAPLINKPFTENHFGILMMRQEDDLLPFINQWMEDIEADGTLADMETRYIK